MADQSDVENELVSVIAAALYPNGQTGDPPPSVLSCPARIGRGWPNGAALDADLRNGYLNVTVYPRPGSERNTSRFVRQWQPLGSPQPATFTLSQAGQVITIGGAQPATYYVQNLCVVCGVEPYTYQVQSGDTLDTIATALGAVLEAALGGVTVSGAEITLPATVMVEALTVGTVGQIAREVSRQERQFQITVWAFNPTIRDQAAALIKPTLDALDFLSLADGSQARIIYALSNENDAPSKEILYRRDLLYLVEWPTLQTASATQIVAASAAVTTPDS